MIEIINKDMVSQIDIINEIQVVMVAKLPNDTILSLKLTYSLTRSLILVSITSLYLQIIVHVFTLFDQKQLIKGRIYYYKKIYKDYRLDRGEYARKN
jgi:hypothetical protein